MPRQRMADDDKAQTSGGASRRKILKASGAGMFAASLAGCTSLPGKSSSKTSFKPGVLLPTSGPYGAIGQNMEKAVKLGFKHTVKRDAYDGEINAVYRDTKTDPGTGRKRAQEVVNQENADILFATWSSAVGMAVQKFVTSQKPEIPYFSFCGTNKITGSACAPYTFDTDTGVAQQASGTVGYAMSQSSASSPKVYQLYANYEWGQSHNRFLKNVLIPRYNAKLVGTSPVPLGKGEYSDVISKAKNSGADIVYCTFAGSDAVAAGKQVEQFGLLDEAVCPFPLTGVVTAKGIPQSALSHKNFIGGTPWYWQLDQPASNKFVDEFTKEYNEKPIGFAAMAYQATRMCFDAIGQLDAKNMKDLDLGKWQKKMEGKQVIPQLHNRGSKLRACDHRTTVPQLAVRGLSPDKADRNNGKIFEVINNPKNPEKQMLDCNNAGCNLSS